MRAALLITTILAGLAACGGDDSSANHAIDAAPDADMSKCGHPGDMGNEKGIGKFCASLSDCSGTTDAPLCSSLGDPDTHFCTRTCTMGNNTVCGTGAECTCNSGNQCGCTPTVCLN